MGKKRGLMGLMLLLILLISGCCIAYEIPGRMAAVHLLSGLWREDSLALRVEGQIMDVPVQADFFRNRLYGDDYYGIQSGGIQLYYQDEGLYFNNGRGYDLSALIPDGAEDWEIWLGLLFLADFEGMTTGESELYRFSVNDSVLDLAVRLAPELEFLRNTLQGLTLTVTEHAGAFQSAVLSGSFGQLRMTLGEKMRIPTEVLMVMKAENTTDVQEILPLILGCIALARQDTVGAEAQLRLECGPLPVAEQVQLYSSKGRLWLLRGGRALELNLGLPEDPAALFSGLGLVMVRDGMIRMEDDGRSYTLTIPPRQVKALFDQLLPEASGMKLEFEDAECSLQVQQGQIRSMALRCAGNMPFLITKIPIAFSMDLTLMEGSPVLPDQIPE